MTQEEEKLLLKDICARWPYGVKVQFHLPNYNTNCFDDKIGEVFEIGNVFTHVHCDGIDYLPNTNRIKPYLRPMSSMTEEEIKETENISRLKYIDGTFAELRQFTLINDNFVDWLNEHHFDYRGLIEKGLAIEAPEDMYKID